RACWRLGAIAAPIDRSAGPGDLEVALAAVRPRLLFAAADTAARQGEGAIKVRNRDREPDTKAFARLGRGGQRAASPVTGAASPARPFDLAVALFTSGSTGPPQAALHTQRGLLAKARTMATIHGLRPTDAVLMPAPRAEISGLLDAVLVPAVAGMKAV